MSASAKKIGNVEKCEETRVEWKIADFFSVVEDRLLNYESLAFLFAGAHWYLQICFSRGYMVLSLCNDEPREYSVEYNFGIRKVDGAVKVLDKGIMEGNEPCDNGYIDILAPYELLQRKSELVPSGVLTATCTVKRGTTDSDLSNASDKLSFIKLISSAEISESKSSLRRAIKLFVFFICIAGFLYQTWTFLQIYLAYPTMLDISEVYPETIIAPAVTICNRNRFFRQRFCKTYPEQCKWQNFTWEEFCDRNRKLCPHEKSRDFNFGIPDVQYFSCPKCPIVNNSNAVLNAVGPQNESDLISFCRFRERASERLCNSSIMIQAAINGFPYKCFSLFSLLGKQNEESLNVTLADAYIIMLNMHPEEYMNNNDLVEASVVLHDPRKVVNPMTEGITLSAGTIYRLYPTMKIRESLPPPYDSQCTDYLKEWKKNGGYGPLSKKDCIDLCKIKGMTKEHGCVGRDITYPNNYTMCTSELTVASLELNKRCAGICQDACEENIYDFSLETVSDLTSKCNQTDEYCKNKGIVILVSFSRMRIQKFKQIPRFEGIELFSYIGGYLGMWLGISLASLFDFGEWIYDIMVYPFLKGRRNQKTTTPIEQFWNYTVRKRNKIVKI